MYGLPDSFIVGTTRRIARATRPTRSRATSTSLWTVFVEKLVQKIIKSAKRSELARKHGVKLS
jgi:hypothetical protein